VTAGRWAPRGVARRPLENRSVHCDACGRVIPHRAWVVGPRSDERVFCEPECERLFEAHVLPRHGGRPW